MCLSTVYKNELTPQNILMSNVAKIECRDGKVIITDLMERQLEIDGDLLFVDLLGAQAIIREHV